MYAALCYKCNSVWHARCRLSWPAIGFYLEMFRKIYLSHLLAMNKEKSLLFMLETERWSKGVIGNIVDKTNAVHHDKHSDFIWLGFEKIPPLIFRKWRKKDIVGYSWWRPKDDKPCFSSVNCLQDALLSVNCLQDALLPVNCLQTAICP